MTALAIDPDYIGQVLKDVLASPLIEAVAATTALIVVGEALLATYDNPRDAPEDLQKFMVGVATITEKVVESFK